ncbi:hypothetical protein ACIQPQ_34660 [Streptomyces sp. NPDC091281]|uniref:hypothetical protein n=1 Tax=Streptomyces sp. NPDC091281 TaxID=3365985 RepID=UPI003820A971
MRPPLLTRLRAYITEVQTRRLRVQLAAATDRNRRLDGQLALLQAANESAYRELAAATGGARFDQAQPFGTWPTGKADAP